jgi:ABC-type anion transport system duplicated permease subunit
MKGSAMSYNAKTGIAYTTIGLVILAVLCGVVFLFLWGCPQYSVYEREMAGKASLAEAENSKLVQITEAQANLEAQKLNAQAEVERAKGAAQAMAEEAGSITPQYIQYLWVRNLATEGADIIYIPTEGGIPLLTRDVDSRLPTFEEYLEEGANNNGEGHIGGDTS